MNIFVLDTDPAIAASYHCDQHLHKMIFIFAGPLSIEIRNLTVPQNTKNTIAKNTHRGHLTRGAA